MRAAAALTSALLLTALVGVPAPGAAAAPPVAPAAGAPAPGVPTTDVIVRWRDGVDAPGRAALRRAAGLVRRGGLPLPDTELARVPAGRSAQALADRLSADPRVAFAEPDAWLRPSSDDPFFGLQWGLENAGQTIGGRVGVAGVDVRAPQAWAAAAGRPGGEVVVAVTDTAVDVTHTELAPRLWRNPVEVVNGLDDDGNGFVDDVHGWDFVTGQPVVPGTTTTDAHGTHVAGTVGAVRDNGVGGAGTTARALLMPVAFIGPDGGPTSAAVTAIAYASDNGAQVINASWGGPSNSRALEEVIARSPAVVIAASGNEGKDNDLAPDYPASYGLANVLSVAAVDNGGRLASFSNRGRLSVDLAAPGVDVVSTVPGETYDSFSGTSMAAPHAAGAAALLRSLRPDLTAGQVVSLLKGTVRPLASLSSTTSTGGLLDVEAAVVAALSGASPAPGSGFPSPPSGTSADAAPQEACPDGVPSAQFGDLVGNVHLGAVDCAVWYGLVRGTGPGTYGPETPLTRGQAASLLAGLVDLAGLLPATAPDAFDDDDGSVHEPNIDRLASLGILTGVGPRQFGPDRPVTRGQVATLLVGTQELLTGVPLPGGLTPFADVLLDVHRSNIEKAYAAGLVRGTSAVTYSPAGSTRRDQAASLVVRELQVLVDVGVVQTRPL